MIHRARLYAPHLSNYAGAASGRTFPCRNAPLSHQATSLPGICRQLVARDEERKADKDSTTMKCEPD